MTTQTSGPTRADLRARLAEVGLRDERRLRRRIDADQDLSVVAGEVDEAVARLAERRMRRPEVSYPEQLPISMRRDDIAAAITAHQVVVVAGETGSGKTTQIPKICLELGRGVRGMIGHTQPRRLAARAVAERIAEELGSPLGEDVGYKVRFHDQVGADSYVKLMTDGILLAEIQNDPLLRAYDTLIVDEAHERSLNIDFLLGFLTQLLPKRPDLKLIITSATIDPGRFAEHFGGAPIVEVSGRTYPVEVRYRPRVEEEDSDQVSAIVRAVDELEAEGPGDILVFLSGEREIRDAADALKDREGSEVVPLYARLTAAEQHRVFAAHRGRRIVLATNVAETSLTVPGIRYVIDPGTARISRYSQRTKVQRLPIEAISQASATQRAGRCGRVEAGICIRLYGEEDFLAREEFTEPEILRTNLASVILQMTALRLGDIADFPFVQPPESRNIRDGMQLLAELGAIVDGRLTPVGRQLAQLPVDPRLGRMLVEADRNGCLHEVLVLAAGLTVQDVRERPQDQPQKAAELHARFADETSDFVSMLNLWHYLQEAQKDRGSSAFRRMCKAELLNHLRVREWQDLHAQLKRAARQLGLTLQKTPATAEVIHQSVLAGMLSHVGLRDAAKRDYLGARGARFGIVPGSALFKKTPRWVVAAELVETNRLWGRVVGRIQPEWVESVADHLVVRSYSEPTWSRQRAGVLAKERVTLYGLPLVTDRSVDFGRIDPVASRELFLRHALVDGDWDTHHAFVADNARVVRDAAELEDRARRRDLVVDDQAVYDFYDARVPGDVVSGRHFDAWWKKTRPAQPGLLSLTLPDLLQESAAGVSPGDYPDVWVTGDLRLALTYQFTPGESSDGVTVHIPLPVLNRVASDGFDWQVPGLRPDLAVALIKSLPKQTRVRLVPAPDTARDILADLEPRQGSFLQAVADGAHRLRRVDVRAEDFDLTKVPDHLRMTFRVFSGTTTLAEGKDLDQLRKRLAPRVQEALSSAAAGIERSGLTRWDFGTLPQVVSEGVVRGYPALVDEGSTVAVRVLATAAQQEQAHRRGVRRLLLLNVPSPLKAVADRLTNVQKLALSRSPHGTVSALLDDCLLAALDDLTREAPRDPDAFGALLAQVKPVLPAKVAEVVAQVEPLLGSAEDLRRWLGAETRPALAASVADLTAQLDALVGPGFVTTLGVGRLADLQRWLRGMAARLDKLPQDHLRDQGTLQRFQDVQAEWARLPASPGKDEVRWLLEELRLGMFAPSVRTRGPVSEKRLYKAIDALV
ncbi:MAG: ATP-dependent helicase HrpA [Frankiales bacterium]|nr:ATP-dependent helicase HrpA [Frankiales bacterium]